MTVINTNSPLRLDGPMGDGLMEMALHGQPVVGGVHGCPGLLGGMEWNGPAYSPPTKTLYVASVDWCGTFTKTDKPPEFTEHAHYYGGAVTPDPRDQARGWLQAIDATTGTIRWKKQWPTPLVAGITATSGGMLFTGDFNNDFLAIDANNGNTLYRFNTGGSVGGGVISYEIAGKQYVATTSGVVSGICVERLSLRNTSSTTLLQTEFTNAPRRSGWAIAKASELIAPKDMPTRMNLSSPILSTNPLVSASWAAIE